MFSIDDFLTLTVIYATSDSIIQAQIGVENTLEISPGI
jgi:hypothetical protein